MNAHLFSKPTALAGRLLVLLVLPLLFGTVAFGQQRPELEDALRRSQPLRVPLQITSAPAKMQADAGLIKLDPLARLTLGVSESAGKQGERRWVDAVRSIASIREAPAEGPVLDVFVRFRSSADVDRLAGYGAEVKSRVGSIAAARVPVAALRALADDPAVISVETSGRSRALLENSRTEIRADQVHAGQGGLPRAYRGKGVVVGVVDSGLDFTHPDFFGPDGRSRVRYLVDMKQGGQNVVWTGADIDANPNAVTERDGNGGGGHGTHVAGTAAGSGRRDADYLGIAPEADLIFVKGIREPDSNGGFDDADVVMGVQYIFDRAEEMGKPAVVNLSLGGHLGPHDGTSNYERALSALTGPGRIIVAAAGNEGNDVIHAGGNLRAGALHETLFYVNEGAPLAGIDVWFDAGAVQEFAIGAVAIVNGELEYLGMSEGIAVGQATGNDFAPLVIDGQTLGYYLLDARTTSDPNNGDGNALFLISNNDDPNVHVENYIWVLFTKAAGGGRLDLWMPVGGELLASCIFSDADDLCGDTEMTVGSPATANGVISVGSYVTGTRWTDVDGTSYVWRGLYQEDPQVGARSMFSSTGPTRDGRMVPDIAAPGERIGAALSSHLTEGNGVQRYNILEGGRYVLMQGTSMASPHVAGVVALLLEADPDLTVDEVRTILRQTARTDGFTGTTPNNGVGAGKVDALAAVKRVAGSGGQNPGGEVATLRSFDPASQPKIWTVTGNGGFVFGTNKYGDQAKAALFTLPAGKSEADLTEVSVYFGYKKAGTDAQTYRLDIFEGTAASGPVGTPIYSQAFTYAGIQADDDYNTISPATVHRLNQAVRVGQTFFVSVDFGNYAPSNQHDVAILATDGQGRRVAEVWEKGQNGAWANLSDAWGGADGWYLWIESRVQTGSPVADEPEPELPGGYQLHPNHPNPFNPVTTLQFELPAAGDVELIVYDMLGRQVATLVKGAMPAGTHSVRFEANGLSSGVYLAQLRAGTFTQVRKMVLMK